MEISEQATRPTSEVGYTPTSETPKEEAVLEQEVIDLLKALPIPVTITHARVGDTILPGG